MDPALEIGLAGRDFYDLVGPLLGDVAALTGGEQVVVLLSTLLLGVEQDCADQTILYEDNPFDITLSENSYPRSTDVPELDRDRLRDADTRFPD